MNWDSERQARVYDAQCFTLRQELHWIHFIGTASTRSNYN